MVKYLRIWCKGSTFAPAFGTMPAGVSEGSVWIYGREVPGPRKSPHAGAGDLWMTGKDTKDVVQEHIVIIMWSTSKDTILY